MATTRISIRKDYTDNGGESKIIIRVYLGNKQINISTPFKVIPNDAFFTVEHLLKKKYTNKHHEVRTPKKFNQDVIEYKAKIDLVVSQLIKAYTDNDINAKLIKNSLELNLNEILSGKTISPNDSFKNGVFTNIYKEWSTEIKDNDKYQSTLEHLLSFEKVQKRKFKIKDIDKTYFSKFCMWFIDQKVGDEYYTHSTIRKHIDHIRWCMNYYLDDFDLNRSYLKFKFPYKTPENALNPQALNQYEIDLLNQYDYGNLHHSLKHLDEIRDLFLFSYSLGGQRISDLPKLIDADFSKGYISFIQTKTNTIVENPLSPLALEILKRNDFKLKKYSDQYINRKLKECISIIVNDPVFQESAFQNMCLDRNVKYVTYRGRTNTPIIVEKPLMEDIKFKYNRSTFISIQASNGWTKEQIAKFTGHKDLSTIDYYLHLYQDKLDELSEQIQANSLFHNLGRYYKPSDLKHSSKESLNFIDKRDLNKKMNTFIKETNRKQGMIRTVNANDIEDIRQMFKEDFQPIISREEYRKKFDQEG